MRTIAVVQARMSSSRFPGKMLEELGGVPLVLFVCQRLARAARVDGVVVATSAERDDDPLANAVTGAGLPVFRGSLDNVLQRFVEAARSQRADAVVRVTGDCPLVDPALVDEMVGRFRAGDLDYYSNVSPPSFPDGLDLEIVRFEALEAALAEVTEEHHREHVTTFIRERPSRFTSANRRYDGADLSTLHWSVDYPEDLALVRDLLHEAGGPSAGLADLLSASERCADIARRSRGGRPNEGAIKTFMKSMEKRAPRPTIAKSEEWWQRAVRVIPAGTQTLSKGPTQFVRGFAPKYLVRGEGSHIWDADGNEYIDYPMGLGPVTLGHGHPEVVAAVTRQLERGNAFSLMHPLEVELAERLTAIVPCAEMVRFGKNGSDATAACIRAARAKTGRKYVARCGYHGWQDWSIDASYGIRSRGVPHEVMQLTQPFPYNDLAALEALLASKPFAAVILEPVSTTPPAPSYLEGVRELATKFGAVLVFDEVITGFRYARGGAQEYFGVTPDLASMGKGVANGQPLSLVVGKREFMEEFEDIFVSFTFGGEVSAFAAAMATLDVMERENYWDHVWRQGRKLQEAYRASARLFGITDVTDCQGMPPWTVVTFADTPPWTGLQLKTLFQQEMIRRGVLFSGSQFISLAHSDEDIARTTTAYEEAMKVLRFALDTRSVDALLQGEVNELVFRRA
jgi:glutamate-1-semialdehyde aminotransferase/spore coat polysaccharide biosynthesis protein SpsF (cytidylyltransferase family)